MTQEPGKPREGENQGEGDYVGGRRFQDAERSFAGEDAIPPHPPVHEAGAARDPHVEENLDKSLDETFPASDPLSISPGAD
jgi:hypothetical protein